MDKSRVYEKLGLFYLGEKIDIPTLKKSGELLLVKNKNLTTHSVIIGMTGSGKTGLGISMIEEAVLDGIPTIVIDPKGDMGNLLLAFDDFNPDDFQKWIDRDEARKKGLSQSEYAQIIAQEWEHGVVSSYQSRDRVKRYKNGADFSIYTPGSLAGIPISVLSSFSAPSKAILDDPDSFSYLLNSTATSILSLVGVDKDVAQSREFLLITTILNYFWRQEVDLELEEIIGYVTNPPFNKIGVLPLKSFYPQKDRLKLAMLLNNLLASPTFSTWREGDSLDIESLLYTKDAKPRVSILSIAHLNDRERMFFVTLFLNKFISWMRMQSGTSALRAMLYMDEIYGFFPSTSNPPSKEPMLLLLKQARAYGINITLSTQNPIDLDYKGLSNIGSWFIGRVQTKQDINRVIDGLLTAKEGSLDKKSISNLLSNLNKRHFLFKSAHRDELSLFTTRWVLSYLRGPLSKSQIETLMHDKKESFLKEDDLNITKREVTKTISSLPPISDEIQQYYYLAIPSQKPSFEPYLVAWATLRYYNAKRSIDKEERFKYKYYLNENDRDIEWSEAEINRDDKRLYSTKYSKESTFSPLPIFISEASNLEALKKEFSNYLYREKSLTLYRAKSLKIESKAKEELSKFKIRIADELNIRRDKAIDKIKSRFNRKKSSLDKRYQKAVLKLEKEEADVSSRTTDTLLSFGMTLLDAFLGKSTIKRSTASRAGATIRNAKRIYSEKSDVDAAKENLLKIDNEIKSLAQELEDEIDAIYDEFSIDRVEIEEFYIRPRRSDIYDVELALLWESRR